MKEKKEKKEKKPKKEKTEKRAKVNPYFHDSSEFLAWLDTLTPEDREKVLFLLEDVNRHVLLSRGEKRAFGIDYEQALLHYKNRNVDLDEALERLSPANLGGFYSRPAKLWFSLDDAGKIYPLSMKHGQMSVFRLSVYFKEPIVPSLLQLALSFTIKRFPSFATTVKKGFFWHFLDTSKRRYSIEEEKEMVCRPLKISSSGSQSFRVLYYKNRMSVEYFHILADGTGGMVFLKTLAAEYLRLLGFDCPKNDEILDINDVPLNGESENAFLRAEKSDAFSGFMEKPALQMSGQLSKARLCRVLHFNMNAEELRRAAKSHGATITAYLLSLMFVAGKCATDELAGDINIQVPVNMRKYYPSKTVRNFSMYCSVRLPIGDISAPGPLIGEISAQLKEKGSKENMSHMMTTTGKLVSMVRPIPLFIKAGGASLVYGYLGDRVFSNTLSNLGVVDMPQSVAHQIESMDFVLGTAVTNRAACALVTFGNTATLTISKMTEDPSFEEKMESLLKADNISFEIGGSEIYES